MPSGTAISGLHVSKSGNLYSFSQTFLPSQSRVKNWVLHAWTLNNKLILGPSTVKKRGKKLKTPFLYCFLHNKSNEICQKFSFLIINIDFKSTILLKRFYFLEFIRHPFIGIEFMRETFAVWYFLYFLHIKETSGHMIEFL